jgi:hypothetical protein
MRGAEEKDGWRVVDDDELAVGVANAKLRTRN